MRTGIVVSWLLCACTLTVGAADAQDAPVPDSLVQQRRELLRTDRFTVYLLDIPPGQATPMHRHDLDIATVFFNSARTVSTFWKEPPRSDPQAAGAVRFRAAGFTHATTNTDTSRFLNIIVAFTQSQGRPDSTVAGRLSDCSQSGPSTCAATALFCLKDVCVLDVTVAPGGVWRATAPVLVVPVISARWSTPGSSVVSRARVLPIGTALYEPSSEVQWRNDGATAARLIAFQVRPNGQSERGAAMSMRPGDSSVTRLPLSPPDVAAARAEEAAALRDIDASLPPGEMKTHILDVLSGRGTPGTWSHFDSPNPEMNARFQRFYAARANRGKEQRREASIAAARGWRAKVVVVLGTLPNGAVAAVLRRRAERPTNVIVLGPNATAEMLGAAFAVFDRSRELTGDDFEDDQAIGVQAASATRADAKDRKEMDDLIAGYGRRRRDRSTE